MITSTSNPTIKAMRALYQRKARAASGLCLLEGIRLVGEAARSGCIERLVVAPELLRSPFADELVRSQAAAGVPLVQVSAAVFSHLALKDGPQGLAAVAHQVWSPLEEVVLAPGIGWVALVAPADPGNVGTIIRTVEAVGAAGVILVGAAADPYDPVALRAAMGATFAVRLVQATWPALQAWCAVRGAPLVGTSDQAASHFQQVAYAQPLVLLMGSERQGLTDEQQACCQHLVRMPMLGRGDSLNLAVATGVMLYELLRQRGGAREGRTSETPPAP
ncbi:MAG: RNA methyltransferase [Candidatus Viridilinea halotolerans]|uniref:RNA methyltransferase n=1 Tax=Candidatus Viridilinea halotolerans TaxID=2491704 RepID=A0A426TRP0_9CHLR|nr:MAG: RNA methyltransferase [Candidatus Viridilinea halotolerans]